MKSKETLRLLGVKATLKRLAVNCELSWQVLREVVVSSFSAETPERRVPRARSGENREKRMIAVVMEVMLSICSIIPGLPSVAEAFNPGLAHPRGILVRHTIQID